MLVKSDGNVKLGDFGAAMKLSQETEQIDETCTLTDRYISPEYANERTVRKATDIWGFGTILLELCQNQLTHKNIRDLSPETIADSIPETFPHEMHKIIPQMLEKDFKQRPTIS